MQKVQAIRDRTGNLHAYAGGEVVEAYSYDNQLFATAEECERFKRLKVAKSTLVDNIRALLREIPYYLAPDIIDSADLDSYHYNAGAALVDELERNQHLLIRLADGMASMIEAQGL